MSIGSVVEGRSIIGISLKLSTSSFFEDMENINDTNFVDTSLDLNTKPLRLFDDSLKQEGASNFIEFVKKIPVKEDEASALLEELNRVNAENKKLTEMLTVMYESYNALRSQFMEYTSKNTTAEADSSASRKRKSEEIINNNNNNNNNMEGAVGACESSSSDEDSSCKKPKEQHTKPKISRVYVQTEASDTSLIVKDGYQWRKYGQKVTRDNPYPRAYFKCSFAPTCPVKKKVQRSVEDHSILVANYEGEHNHPEFAKIEAAAAATSAAARIGPVSCTTGHSSSSAPPTITLDLTKSSAVDNEGRRIIPNSKVDSSSPELQKSLVEQMAFSLTNDPNFRAALAAAISGKILRPH